MGGRAPEILFLELEGGYRSTRHLVIHLFCFTSCIFFFFFDLASQHVGS